MEELTGMRNEQNLSFAIQIYRYAMSRSEMYTLNKIPSVCDPYILIQHLSKFEPHYQMCMISNFPIEDILKISYFNEHHKILIEYLQNVEIKRIAVSKFMELRDIVEKITDIELSNVKTRYYWEYREILMKGIYGNFNPRFDRFDRFLTKIMNKRDYHRELLFTKYLMFEEIFINATELKEKEFEDLFDKICILFGKNIPRDFNIRNLNSYTSLALFSLLKNEYTSNIIKYMLQNEFTHILNSKKPAELIQQDDYSISIDVHDIGRDNLTKKIIFAFYDQYTVPKENQQILMEQFWDYLETLPENKKDIVIRCLGRDKFNEIRRKNEDFGGLATSTYLKKLDFDDIISSLVYFCNIYEDRTCEDEKCIEKMRNVALKSLFDSLVNSYEDGHTVCDEGKFQQIVSGLLSGRFVYEGKILEFEKLAMDIDRDRIEIKKITDFYIIRDYMNNFFRNSNFVHGNGNQFLRNIFLYACDLMNNRIYIDPKFLILYVFFIDPYCLYYLPNGINCVDFDIENSLISHEEDILKSNEYKYYLENHLVDDMQKFNESNPQIVELREEYIAKQERLRKRKIIS